MNYYKQQGKVRILAAREQVGRLATPASIRKTLVNYHNRNLKMVPTDELRVLEATLTKNGAEGDVRSRILLQNTINVLSTRTA